MVYLVRKLLESYNYFFHEVKDPRSAKFLFMGNPPLLITIILGGYLLMIKYGPKLMEPRKPFELKSILVAYNFAQILLNAALCVYGAYRQFIAQKFDFACQPINFSATDAGIMELKLVFCYFLLKLLDLLDTLFIILKKNNSHLSFLHCYHHFMMALGVNFGVRWVPGGHGSLLGIVNCFVHAVMYFYFFLTAFNQKLKESIWWKKHITQLQMVQFAVLIVHFFRAALSGTCSYPKFWSWLLAIQNSFMLILFLDFYIRAYLRSKSIAVNKIK